MKPLKLLISTYFIGITACSPPPPPELPKGKIRISTIPGDAKLTINSEYKGNSPTEDDQYFVISLTEGTHQVDALLNVSEELQKVATKTLFLASDTEQTVTLKLEDRLTQYGKEQKAIRDAEIAEKARIVEEKRRKDAAIAEEKRQKAAAAALQKKKEAEAKALDEKRKAAAKAALVKSATDSREEIKTNGGAIYSVAMSPDGTKVAAGQYGRKATIWNVNSGEVISTTGWGSTGLFSSEVYSLRFLPDGQRLFAQAATARVINVSSGHTEVNFSGDGLNTATVSNDGKLVAVGSKYGQTTVYEAHNGATIRTFDSSTKGIGEVAISPDNRFVASGGLNDDVIKVWQIDTGTEMNAIKIDDDINKILYSKNGSQLLIATDSGLEFRNVNTGVLSKTYVEKKSVESVAVSPDSKLIALGYYGRAAEILDMSTGKILARLEFSGRTGRVHVDFSPDGKSLIVGSNANYRNISIHNIQKEIAAYQ